MPTLYNWSDRYGWHDKADERDQKAAAVVEQKAIADKVRRLEEHLKTGTILRQRGVQWLLHNEVTCARDALAFVKTGIEIERQSDGLPDIYLKIANATSIEELEDIEAADCDGDSPT